LSSFNSAAGTQTGGIETGAFTGQGEDNPPVSRAGSSNLV
jgi:hypothetical protein